MHQVAAERFGGVLSEDFTARCHERVFAAFREGVAAVPGAVEVLGELRRRCAGWCRGTAWWWRTVRTGCWRRGPRGWTCWGTRR
ncbi:hypothetical protein KSE_29265 [Kitasatospora setae KM-6054]|uniref:Uncharacterized protein n=1 Tax=Kitasatospora setae (strain ATCC 33774 / DSM 43861 / JCM 3304 / KCC A-0304 / NBRC 14216 / KM-6054) TaxID=452652 RepID=E4NC07_KITSK|nr:hypothetical protein KSE_29265 [Kitasatospora setae KM-6054]